MGKVDWGVFAKRTLNVERVQELLGQGKRLPLTIESVAMEEVGRGDAAETKSVVHFKEIREGLVLNRSNALVLKTEVGADDDLWVGLGVELFLAPNHFGS